MSVFSVEDRAHVRSRVLELASTDERVVAGAVVGSLAHDDGDRWSDLDLTFAVADGVPVADVLSDWTRSLVDELEALHLFDLPSGTTIYRVFLLPGCLQLDVSFGPASDFGAAGPTFELLWGFDDLPADVRNGFADALVSSLERDELLRALGRAIAGLLREAHDVRDLATKAEPELRALTAGWHP